MTTYSQLATPSAGPRKPPRRMLLPASAFADTWAGKPAADSNVVVGLRLISENDVQYAKAEADAHAKRLYTDHRAEGEVTSEEGLIEARNDALMRFCLARAACDVNDVTKAYFRLGKDQLDEVLTSEAISRLWDELLILHAESSIRIEPAKDAAIERLARVLLDARAVAALAPSTALEVRKLLAHCLGLLEATGQAHEAASEEDGGYVVHLAE